MKRILPSLFALLLCLCLTACGEPSTPQGTPSEDGVFTHRGLTVTLTADFVDYSEGEQFIYISQPCMVDGYCHAKEEIIDPSATEMPTLTQYAELWLGEGVTLTPVADTPYYAATTTRQDLTVWCVFAETDTCFYLIRFTAESKFSSTVRPRS